MLFKRFLIKCLGLFINNSATTLLGRQTKVSIVRSKRNFQVMYLDRMDDCRIGNSNLQKRRDASRRQSRITAARKSRLFRPFDVVLRSRSLYFPRRYHRWQVDRKCLAGGETIAQNCMTHREMISRESISSRYKGILYIYILYLCK